jgi:hypothetical protein
MARNVKPGITFYRMDSGHILNKKVRLLFNDFDSDGYYIWKALLDYSYLHNGYYFNYNDKDVFELFATDFCKKKIALVKEVIAGCIRRGLFDKNVADSFGILTSEMMQEVYVYGTAERRRQGSVFSMQQEWLLLDFKQQIPVNIELVPVKNKLSSREESTDKTKQDLDKTKQESFAPENPSPPKIAKAKKQEEPEPYWKKLVDAWFEFNKKHFQEEPSFKGRDPKFFKSIIENLKKRAAKKNVEWTEVEALRRLNGFLVAAFTDEWLCKHFLLENLDKQFDKIILQTAKSATQQKAAVPIIPDKMPAEINYLYERFLEDACTTISIELDHFFYLQKNGFVEFSNSEIENIRIEATKWANETGKDVGDRVGNQMKRMIVIEIFKQYKAHGKECIFELGRKENSAA